MNPRGPESFQGASQVQNPEASVFNVESAANKEKTLETTPTTQESKAPAQSYAPQMPILPTPQQQPVSLTVKDDSSNPIAAADEDLIEKEWVQKAKKIIYDTKDDPYSKENEISKLQADYIKKRYGKEIKTAGES